MRLFTIPLMTVLLFSSSLLFTAETPTRADVDELATLAQSWLVQQQEDDGSFLPGDRFKLGITTVVAVSLLDNGMPADDPRIRKASDFIKSFIQPDGGIYNPQEGLANYTTSLGLRVLVRTAAISDEQRTSAQNYLLGLQNTDPESVSYGGIGYGQRGQGNEDLSNTSMAIEALVESGLSPDHPGLQRALEFVTRCQNLSSHNDMPWAGNDGGGVYSPDSSMAAGSFQSEDQTSPHQEGQGEGAAPTTLQSYGSMTYALINSYIYLDLSPEDPRLQAALGWVRNNYQFVANPGMPSGQEREGLFYYYQAMSKTFDILDQQTMALPDGQEVDWRSDLYQAIKQRATVIDGPDGSPALALWINDMPRWAEGIPHLTTAYILGCLSRIRNSLPE